MEVLHKICEGWKAWNRHLNIYFIGAFYLTHTLLVNVNLHFFSFLSAGLVSGEKICLNPRTMWVKKLIRFIEKKEKVIKNA